VPTVEKILPNALDAGFFDGLDVVDRWIREIRWIPDIEEVAW